MLLTSDEVVQAMIRENTERPVTVEQGTNYLVGTDPAAILAASAEILSGRGKKGTVPPFWDGHAAERIADILLRQWTAPYELRTSCAKAPFPGAFEFAGPAAWWRRIGC